MSDKVFQATFYQNLRHGPGVTEDIGNPGCFRYYTELLFQETFSNHNLTDKGFSADQIAIGLNPEGTDGFPATLFNTFLHLPVHIGVEPLHLFVQKGLTL